MGCLRIIGCARKISVIVFWQIALCPLPGYSSESISADALNYLQLLVAKSRQETLANDRGWLTLLHYQTNHSGSLIESEVDDPEFFLDADGKTDPVAELDATLRAFVMGGGVEADALSPRCRFPARFHWLNSRLRFDSAYVPDIRCEQLESWRERKKTSSVSLVFASYYFNNPASMFGHTFLRLESEDSERPDLLDFAVSFAADPQDTDSFAQYLWRGTTGKFKGFYSVDLYYDLIKKYSEYENRDLWEYKLDLNAPQIDLLLLHVWELIHTHIDFYFFRENCSYHLLSLIEVAAPELRLRDEHRAWTIPVDTVKQVVRQAGLVTNITHIPSIGSRLNGLLARLDRPHRVIVRSLAHDPGPGGMAELGRLPPEQQVPIIDAAIEYQLYLDQLEAEGPLFRRKRLHSLMTQRSQLPTGSEGGDWRFLPEVVSPDNGHDSMRLEILGGDYRPGDDWVGLEDETYLELSIQAGFHDLLSNEIGHAPNSQIKVLGIRARLNAEREEWRTQEVLLLDIISLFPISDFASDLSWKFRAGWQANEDGACADCTPFVLNGGAGLTFQSDWYRREIYFGFLEAIAEYDSEFANHYRLGAVATIGLLFDIAEFWRTALTINRIRYATETSRYKSIFAIDQRYYLSPNSDLIFDMQKSDNSTKVELGIAYHF